MSHPLLDKLSEPRARWWIAGGVLVLALALGGFALTNRGAADAQGAGPGLNIAVVPPVERDVHPGEVMDVGRLNDGFDGRLPEAPPPPTDADYYAEQPAYVEDDWRAEDRQAPRYDDRSDYEAPIAPAVEDRRDERKPRPMSFGFDQPLPDWRAEREARRAALEARIEARAQRDAERRVYSSSGAQLSRESEFY